MAPTNLARWLSRDRIEESGGLNLYAYVQNRVLNARDFLGLAEGDYAGATRDALQKAFDRGYDARYVKDVPTPELEKALDKLQRGLEKFKELGKPVEYIKDFEQRCKMLEDTLFEREFPWWKRLLLTPVKILLKLPILFIGPEEMYLARASRASTFAAQRREELGGGYFFDSPTSDEIASRDNIPILENGLY